MLDSEVIAHSNHKLVVNACGPRALGKSDGDEGGSTGNSRNPQSICSQPVIWMDDMLALNIGPSFKEIIILGRRGRPPNRMATSRNYSGKDLIHALDDESTFFSRSKPAVEVLVIFEKHIF